MIINDAKTRTMQLTPIILIIDDEPEIASAYSLILSREGYRAVSAAEGLEALRLAEREQPDIVLLDINLSGWDGLRLLGSLQVLAADASIIVVSGYLDPATEEVAMDCGAKECLAKPVSAAVLKACIATTLANSASSVELRRKLLALPR